MIQRPLAVAGLLLAGLTLGCTSGNPNRPGQSRWTPQEPAPEAGADDPAPKAAAAETTASSQSPGGAPEEPAPSEPGEVVSSVGVPLDASLTGAAFGMQEAGAIPVIANVSGETIHVGELLDAWMQINSPEVSDVLERLVSAKLVEIEARRGGIALTSEQIEAGYQATLAEMEKELAATNPGMTLDDWIIGALGMDVDHYHAGLRTDVVRQLLAPLVVRAFTLGHERRQVRVLVTESRDEIEDALAAYRQGTDFGVLVTERSIDPNKEIGGRIQAIMRGNSPLSRLVFLTDVGEVGGPIQDETQGRWMIVHVDSEEPILDGPWAEIHPRIEASLAEEGITDPEYWQWKAEMSRRHKVDLEPLFELMQTGS